MAGLIREEDIALVRERADLVDIIGQDVELKPAGGGAMKGLCPFHDEKSPSFHVRPGRGYHCFGCGEGGDVISFLMKHRGLAFSQAVEYLAEQVGVQLRYTEGNEQPRQRTGPTRQRLIEAHRLAQEFYAGQLETPDAMPARQFLAGRGFDQDAAATFGVGFAPREGEALYKHLRAKGFSDAELVTGGLVAQGQRSHYDRFRGRLVWPIRETSGETIGFGARRILDDDRIEAKYLNTSESPIYKKSQVLYGIDLARREIGRTSQAVIVEGYTDVMACHLAGVTTAVATCGTAFGEDHGRVLRRLLGDQQERPGEVVFTFDGDEAGQKAAMRAFGGDQQFVGQTYVAVEPDGLDPCDLRLAKGDEGVRDLVAGRVPLYRFVLGNVVRRYDLDRADSRVDALREGAKLVTSVRDRSKVEAFARELARMVGVDIDEARAEVRRAAARGPAQEKGRAPAHTQPQAPGVPAPRGPDPNDPRLRLERETLKLAVQAPALLAPLPALADHDFTHPAYRAVWRSVDAAGGPAQAAGPAVWVDRLRSGLREQEHAEVLIRILNGLAVEPSRVAGEPDAIFASANVYSLLEQTAARRTAELSSRLQRTDPAAQPGDHDRLNQELMQAEAQRRRLRERAVGGSQ